MENSGQTAEALNQRIDRLCDDLMNRYLRIVACVSGDPDTSLSTTAQNELSLVDHVTAFKRSVEDLSSLIRELQEIWLFGSLDTLTDPGDEATRRERTIAAAKQIQELVNSLPNTTKTSAEGIADQNGERSQNQEADYASTSSHTLSPDPFQDMFSPDTIRDDTSPDTVVGTPWEGTDDTLPWEMENMRVRED